MNDNKEASIWRSEGRQVQMQWPKPGVGVWGQAAESGSELLVGASKSDRIKSKRWWVPGLIRPWKFIKEFDFDFIFMGPKITSNGNCSHAKKNISHWRKSYDKPRKHIKKQRYHFPHKSPSSQGYGFSSSHIWMWELDCKESWVPKN